MSYIENVNTRQQDTADIDAAGRTRVSEVYTQIDIKQTNDNNPLLVDELLNGTATATYNSSISSTTLATAANGDYAIKQTFQRLNYQSGKSHLVFLTFNGFGTTAGVTKRVGYFDSSTTAPYTADVDGLYLESDSSDISVNVALNGTVTQVNQSAFNLDTLDGNGDSGITIDWDENQILVIDFLWLGVSRVRWGLDVGGMIIYFHESNHANITTDVYMSTPNKPLRWEIRQADVTAGSFDYICASVNSEGSINKLGKIHSDNLGTSHVNANSTSQKYALIGIELQAGKVDTLVDIIDFTILSETNDNQLVEVWYNPTVSGTFTYNNITDSSCAVAKGSGNTVSGGTLLYSQYISSQVATPFEIDNAIRLGMAIDGTLGTIVVSTNPLTSNSDVLASINWRELT